MIVSNLLKSRARIVLFLVLFFNYGVVYSQGTTTPSAPTITYSTGVSGGVALSFISPSSDGGTSISNYEYSVDGGSSWTAFSPVVTTSPVRITGLTNGTSYTIALRAVNSVGSGSASNLVSVTPLNLASLGAITIVASGGAAENSTWRYANNTISPTSSTAVSLNVSEVIAKLAMGDLRVEGSAITVNADLLNTANSNNLTLKATGNVILNHGNKITTDGGNVVFQADADENRVGGIRIGSDNAGVFTTAIETNGGDIVLSGGVFPETGFASYDAGLGSAFSTYFYGLGIFGATLNASGSNATGGDIVLRGNAGNSFNGLLWTVNLGGQYGANTSIKTNGNGTITVVGDMGDAPANLTANNSRNAWAVSIPATLETAAGNIRLIGKSNVARTNSRGFAISGTVQSSSGAILLEDQTLNTNSANYSGPFINGSSFGKGTLASSTSNVTWRADKFAFGGTPTINTSGLVTIEPFGGSFLADLSSASISIANSPTGLTIGKSTNTSNITIANAVTVAGPVDIYGNDVTVSSALTVSGAADKILLQSKNHTVISAAITSNGGDVTIWSDSDNNGTGGIRVNDNVSIDSRTQSDRTANTHTSGGGKITLAGGLDDAGAASGVGALVSGLVAGDGYPDGYAANSGSTATQSGIVLGTSTSATGHNSNINIFSGGGNIRLQGLVTNNTSSPANGPTGLLFFHGYTINAGTNGDVTLLGNAALTSLSGGIGMDLAAWREFSYTASGITRTVNGNILLIGRASGGTSFNLGVAIDGTGDKRNVFAATGTGTVTFKGLATGTGATDVRLTNVDMLAASGNISVIAEGTAGSAIGGYNIGDGLFLGQKTGSLVANSASNVVLRSNTLSTNKPISFNTSGTVTIEPFANSFSSAQSLSNLQFSNTVSGLTLGKSSNTSNLTLGSATTISGPVVLYGQDLAINAPLTATNSAINFHATGTVTQSAAITANDLDLTGSGTFTLTNTSNNVVTIAGGDNTTALGSLSYTDATGGLTIGTVGNKTGLTATGAILVETLDGDLTWSQNIATSNTGTDAIVLNAGKTAAIGTTTGGNIIISGTPTLTTGSGGIAKLFSGSSAASTGLTTLVGGSANVRLGVDETTTSFSPALSANTAYALYRISLPAAPTSLNLTAGNEKLTIAFTPGASGGSTITNYEYTIDGGTTWIAFSPAVTSSPVTITGLTNGTAYTVQLRAVNSLGSGSSSSSVSGTPTCSASLQFKLSPPNVTTSAIQGQNSSLTESFNNFSVGALPASGSFANGTYTNSGTTNISANDQWGGSGSQYLGVSNAATVNLTLTTPSRYLGFWWGAGDGGNRVRVYGTCSGTEILLGTFSSQDVLNLLANTNVTAVDGTSYPSSQYKRSNAANQAFAYINLELNDPSIYFSRIEFNHTSVGGFEVDNITTSTSYGAATATTPSAPTITSVSVANGSATVNFTAPSSNGGSAITNYEYSTDNGATWTAFSPAVTTSPALIPGLGNGTAAVKIRAVNTIGSGAESNGFNVTANTPPTITSLVNQTTSGTTPTTAQNFTVGDAETAAASLTVTASSSNTTLIPTANIVLSGSGATRTVVVTAASGQTGTATITLTVNDGTGATATSTFTVTVNDPNCSTFSPLDFQLNGNATVSNNIITLTTATFNQRGGAWNKNKIFLDKDFDISSRINLGSSDAGADGIAFVLQNQSINAGSSGGGLGYSGITPSFAVEFDTWYNGSFEPVQDHMAIIANGATAGAHNTYVTPYEVQMEDGQWHNVRFVWTANTKNFQAWYDGVKRFDITVDLKANVFNNAEYVFWGLTAATGGAVNLQQVEITNYCYTKQASITPRAGTNNSSAAVNLCAGSDVVLEASSATTYQWFKDGVAISGATQQTLTVSEAGSYKVEANANGITTVSESTVVTVSALPSISYASATYSFIRNNTITSMSPILASGSATPSSYSVSPALPTGLTLNTATGVISGRPTALAATADYLITASTAAGCTATFTLSLEVKNDAAPLNLVYNPNTQTVRQGTAITNMVPTVSGGTVITYTISPALPSGITINATTGVVSGTLTSAQTGSQAYTVTATNTGGTATATITLIYNSAPTDIVLSSSSIVENNAANATVGTMSSTDPDAGDTHTYSLVSGTGSTDNAAFTISGNSLRVNSVLNFETKSSYSIRIRTTDAGGLSFEKVFTIAVSNQNEAPTNITSSQTAIYEGNATGATVGNLTSTDPDAGDTHTYTLVSGTGSTDNASFSISGNQLKAVAVLDFKTKNSYSIRIRTTDAGGLSFEKVFTVTVLESPFATGTGNLPGSQQITAASNDVTISKGYSSQLDVTGSGLVTYSWSPSIGLSATNIANPVASPSETTVYTVTVTNNLGLSTVVYVTVNVIEDYNLTPNNLITPNGDGVNDTWVIGNLNTYPDNEVQLFDKAGRILYQVKGYQNNWDGTLNGNYLTEGTYFYVIRIGSKGFIKKGYINIIRE